ncbi:TonB family protein [Thermomonas aquatica]|nr:TonB family protein [Thermomonas aquatica]
MLRSIVLAAAMVAAAGATAATKLQIAEGESVVTLRIDGELNIGPEGQVQAYRIRTRLDPKIQALVAKAVPGWQFKPVLVDGKPVNAKTPMRITLAATETKGGYEVRVDNVVFTPYSKEDYEAQLASKKALAEQGKTLTTLDDAMPPSQPVEITSIKLAPPGYPKGLQMAGVEGMVLLNLRLNPDGTVAEVFASQSSLLNVKGRPELLDRARVMLEKNASSAAAKWTFKVQAKDPAALKPSDLTVRIPVDYALSSPGRKGDPLVGSWRREFRGPNYPVPWLLGGEGEQAIGVSDLGSGEFIAGTSPFALGDKSVIGKSL